MLFMMANGQAVNVVPQMQNNLFMASKLTKLFFGGICVIFLGKLLSMSVWVYPDMWWYKDRGMLISLWYAANYAVKPLALIVLLGVFYIYIGGANLITRVPRIFAVIGGISQLLISSSQRLVLEFKIQSELVPISSYVGVNKLGLWWGFYNFHGLVLGYFLGLAIAHIYLTVVSQKNLDDDRNEQINIWLWIIWIAGITSIIFPKLLYAFQDPNCGIIMDAKLNIAHVIAQMLNASFFFFIWGVVAVYLIGKKPLNAAIIIRRKVGVVSAVVLALHQNTFPFFDLICSMQAFINSLPNPIPLVSSDVAIPLNLQE